MYKWKKALLHTHTVIPSVLGRQHQLLGAAVLQEVSGSPPSLVEDSTLPGPTAEPLDIPIDPLLLQTLARRPGRLEESIMSSQVTFRLMRRQEWSYFHLQDTQSQVGRQSVRRKCQHTKRSSSTSYERCSTASKK